MSVQNYQMHAPQRSNSTGSLSEKSQASTGIELGFNCDSPQGGTIRKKPKPESENKPKPAKGVRFKESFATIPIGKSIFQSILNVLETYQPKYPKNCISFEGVPLDDDLLKAS